MNTTLEGEWVRQSPGVAGDYPVSVEFPRPDNNNMLYAVPILGMVLKIVMLIPFFIAMCIVSMIVWLAQLVLWIPVLFVGVYPAIGFVLVGGYVRWYTRVGGFLFGLSDKYPSFSFADEPGGGDPIVTFEQQRSATRGWAIPFVGFFAKMICLWPHMIVLSALRMACFAFMLVSWVPVLMNGRFAKVPYDLYAGTIRWQVRVYAFLYGLTDQYPPFSLS